MKTPKSATLSELIKILQQVKKERGDLPVYLAKDCEGNGFSSINTQSLISYVNGGVTIWPYQRFY